MTNPDVVLELERSEQGAVTKLSYTAHNPGDQNFRAIEFLEIVRYMCGAYTLDFVPGDEDAERADS